MFSCFAKGFLPENYRKGDMKALTPKTQLVKRNWDKLRVKSWKKSEKWTEYEIYLDDIELATRRYTDFENLSSDMKKVGITLVSFWFPSKFRLENHMLYMKRMEKFTRLIRELTEKVILENSLPGQQILQNFFRIPKEHRFVPYILQRTRNYQVNLNYNYLSHLDEHPVEKSVEILLKQRTKIIPGPNYESDIE